jgi:hypothetical protein
MSRRARRPELIKLADDLGAVKGKRIDWYLVAEHQWRIAHPGLVENPVVPAKQRDAFYLVQDVGEVRRQKRCGVLNACGWLASGYLPWTQLVTRADGSKVRVRFASEDWTKRPGAHWKRRYYEFIKASRDAQKHLATARGRSRSRSR